MNAKQQRFADEYLVDMNGTQAAIRAGYSKKSAHVTGCRLLRDAKVGKSVEAKEAKIIERAELTAEEIINGIRATVRRCETEGDEFQPFAVLKGYELLGKRLKMWIDKVEVSNDLRNMSDGELLQTLERMGHTVTVIDEPTRSDTAN